MGIFYENLIYGVRIFNKVDQDVDVIEKEILIKEILFDYPLDINNKELFITKLKELIDVPSNYTFHLFRDNMTTSYDGIQTSRSWSYFDMKDL